MIFSIQADTYRTGMLFTHPCCSHEDFKGHLNTLLLSHYIRCSWNTILIDQQMRLRSLWSNTSLELTDLIVFKGHLQKHLKKIILYAIFYPFTSPTKKNRIEYWYILTSCLPYLFKNTVIKITWQRGEGGETMGGDVRDWKAGRKKSQWG